jgi:hypothetical protein
MKRIDDISRESSRKTEWKNSNLTLKTEGVHQSGKRIDGIENHPFHPEIEDDWLLVHQATDPKRPTLMSFFQKKRTAKRL